ncbi:MAG TPA: hypothetical protein H9867_00825 [Candidatus Corynebacterium gallistercoris]|uniref:LGFP repeat-containing protein n=1 Tax=Candidatus Corynebacterium gallistercoris TaxID=2838530 RepID=A0A9D1UP89_9CORY|nr:hypothetical protein [Candidatus Corynebacterium gallistercoris]
MNRSMKIRRSALAVAAGAGLVLGAAACSDDSDNNTASSASSAANEAKETASSAVEGSESAEASESEGSDSDVQGETVDVEDVNGETVAIPADIAAEWERMGADKGHLGKVTEVDVADNGTLVTFEDGLFAHSPETGAVPLKGKIAEKWVEGGALGHELGLPTAPEEGDAVNGWTQQFQNGTMEWSAGDNGEFTETVTLN